MDRINVYTYDSDGTRRWAGWFDMDAAAVIEEDTTWNGNSHVSVHAASFDQVPARHRQFHHERLIRTRKGEWVLHHWSQYQGDEPRYTYVTDHAALTWLSVNNSTAEIEKYFGRQEEGRGPGRPTAGEGGKGYLPVTSVGEVLLDRLNAEATAHGEARAETVRKLLEEALDARDKLRSEA
ncbi:hypothetical protein [Micromonospora aurantiaca (nom. illeg.)]|uniref:hypothetical protein n=1 Tax=Micromonospora aurantiaca (nom. illeg.) TaxID=47850 RepID=UPI0033E386BB